MGTKVKGHRIENEAIEKKHINTSVKFNEDEDLILNHPTHDNSTDLTSEQNQIITQGGNADLMHYHSGGAGGEAGILTRKQIDKTLMNLMLKINSIETGLDNAIIDQLDDIRDLDHGYNSPIINNINVIDGATLENSLIENQTYGYRLMAKVDGGHTNTSNDYYVNIPEGYMFPNTLLDFELPEENTGYQLFRKKVTKMEYNMKFNDILNFYSPEEVEYEIIPSDYFSNDDYLKIYSKESKVRTINTTNNLFENSSNDPLNFGEFDVNENYSGENIYLALKTNTFTNKLDEIKISFYNNELDIARDFKIEFTTDQDPSIYDDSIWQGFNGLYRKNESEVDFVITDSTISNNEEYTVYLGFETVRNITAIRFTVIDRVQAVYITDIHSPNLLATGTNEIGHINKKLITGFDSNDVRNVEYKLKALTNDFPTIDMRFKNEKGWYYPQTQYHINHDTNSTQYTETDRIIRTVIDGVYNYQNINQDDFFSIVLRNANPGEPITIKDMNIVVNNTTDQKDIINHNFETLTDITFNDGETVYTTTDEYIISDPFKIQNFPAGTFDDMRFPIVTFEIIGEATFYYHSDGYNYTYTADPLVADTRHPGNDGTFVSRRSNYTPVVLWKFYNDRYTRLENTSNEMNSRDFRKDLNINVFSHTMLNFNVSEVEFHISNSTSDNIVDIADVKFHNKKEIFSSGYMKEYTLNQQEEEMLNNVGDYYETNVYPTQYDPIISTYLLKEPHIVDHLRMDFLNANTTPKDFRVQVTPSSNATLGDPETSDIWTDIQNPHLLSKLIENEHFTGTIDSSNGVMNNNLMDLEFDIGFDPVEIQGIRFIFYSAISPSAEIRFRHAYLYEASNGNDTYDLIKDESVSQPKYFNIIDDNLQSLSSYSLTDLPVNETGTRNIWFNGSKKLLEVIDKTKPGIVETETIQTDGVLNFLMNLQKVIPNELNDAIETYISNDDGETYKQIIDFESVNTMSTIGGAIKLKFVLINDAKLNAYSLLYSL